MLSKMGLDQPLAMLPNVVSSSRLSLVLEAKQFLFVGSPVLENWADQMETELSPFLVFGTTSDGAWKTITDAKSVLKDNVKLFCIKFASQMSLEAVFLVELTSSVYLATLKIAKSLVVSESGSPSAAVVLYNVLLGVFAADIKMTFDVFVDKDSVRIFPLVNQQETIVSYNKFKAKLVNLLPGCTVFMISNMISQFSLLVAAAVPVAIVNSLVFSQLAFLKSDLAKLSVLVESIVKLVGSMVKVFEQFVNSDLVSSSVLGLKVNKVLVHMSIFSRAVGKLEQEVVTLKTECGFEDVDMSGLHTDVFKTAE
ncbi:hypothetical protein G9A89_014544 [Geosiphon pyriformis]|nr:hypothetical protein G9A89_014544 [Geosiphon pyriformis]